MMPHQVLPRQVLPHQVIPSVQALSCSSSQAETKDFNEDRATDPRFKLSSSSSSSLVVSSTTIGRKEHQRCAGGEKNPRLPFLCQGLTSESTTGPWCLDRNSASFSHSSFIRVVFATFITSMDGRNFLPQQSMV